MYSLSVLYLHIFGNISKIFSLNKTFISKITIELSKNINPEPSKRSSLSKLLENFDNLFNDENNWFYIRNLLSSKMSQLVYNLDK